MFDQLNEFDRKMIEESPNYTIPWDVGFKEESVTTPARPTFDASSKTQGGLSLNENLAKGRASLINMLHMVLKWLVGISILQLCTSTQGALEVSTGCVV